MIILYKPNGGEERRFLIHPDGLTLDEINEIETCTGLGLAEFIAKLTTGRFGVIRPLLYVYLKRETPSIKYKDVNPYITEIQVVSSRSDYIAEREKVAENPNYPNRDAVLEFLDSLIADAPDLDGPGKGPAASRRTTSAGRQSRKRGSGAG